MDLKEESILGDAVERHWYYRSKRAALLRYIQPLKVTSVLDVGAGSGFFSKALLRETEARDALCLDPQYEKEWEESLSGKPIRFRKGCDRSDADLVLMMDVIEHVEDDVSLIGEYAAKVPRGTHFLVTVPAFSFLWSAHDVFLGHRRRYTLSQLLDVMERGGIEVEKASYYFSLVLPIAVLTRSLDRMTRGVDTNQSQLREHSSLVNNFLGGLCMLDLHLLDINRLAGLSVFCLGCRK